jgi:4-hydroxybenzoate polyprenyltransferase
MATPEHTGLGAVGCSLDGGVRVRTNALLERAWAFGQLLRLPDWIKNTFIFAALIFSGGLRSPARVEAALWAFVSFSLIAATVYVLNDWQDRAADRLHPEKRRRPIARGLISGPAALLFGVCLMTAGFAVAVTRVNWPVAGLEAAYLVINAAYSLGMKRVVILEALAVASGFVIRVLVGAAAVGVQPSHWLLLCTLFLALFLTFAKRHGELLVLAQGGAEHRSVLSAYTPAFIGQLNILLCSVCLLAYSLYAAAPDTVARLGSDHLIYTVPLVLYGLLRYLYLVQVKGEGGNPSKLVLRDRSLAGCILVWVLLCAAIIY